MSRHRDVRCMNYSDEYDGYDDVYGHSVEDDYCVSPGAEQFIYDRNKQANIASFITEPDIVEDNEEAEEDIPSSYKLPKLSELDAAKLISCVESIKNVIGDTYPESELNKKIIEFNFNTEAVLNSILSDEVSKSLKDKSPVEKEVETQAGSKSEKLFSCRSNERSHNKMSTKEKSNLNNGCENSDNVGFTSLADMISKTTNPSGVSSNSSASFNSLSDLTNHHMNTTEKKKNLPSGFTIPKMSFNTPKLCTDNPSASTNNSPSDFTIPKISFNSSKLSTDNSSVSNNNSPLGFTIPKMSFNNSPKLSADNSSASLSFSCLADLTAHHLKISDENNSVQENTAKSHSDFIIPKIASKDFEAKAGSSSPTFSSLAELTAHHLKISSKEKNDSTNNINSPSAFNIPNISSKSMTNSQTFYSLADLTKHHLKIEKNSDLSNFTIPNLSIKIKKEKLSNSILEDISNLNYEEKLGPNKALIDTVHIKKEKLDNVKMENQPINFYESTIAAIKRECMSNNRNNIAFSQKKVSSFGKILCKRYKRKTPYRKKENNIGVVSETVVRFDFSSPSPDSIILARLRKTIAT